VRVHGLILAGGQGSRLGGVRKAELRLGGVPLIARVAARLGAGLARPLLIATGPAATAYAQGVGIADDPAGPAGPLAGLLAGLRHLADMARNEDVLVTVAVDTPFLPVDYVARLTAALAAGAPAAFAQWGPSPYPTNAAWRIGMLRRLAKAVQRADTAPGPRRLLEEAGAAAVDWSDSAARDPFANLNTLADLVALSRRDRGGAE